MPSDIFRLSPNARREPRGFCARGVCGLLAVLVLGVCAESVFADDLLRAAQQELRARKLYLGPIDGRNSAASTAAIRRLQALKGIDQSGDLDDDTQRALGLRHATIDPFAEKGCALVQQYLAATSAGDVDRAAGFFAESVEWFEDGAVARDFVRQVHTRENARWPQRRCTLLNRIATANPVRTGEMLVPRASAPRSARKIARRVR